MSQPAAGVMAEMEHGCWSRIGVRGDGSCVELKQYVHCRNCPVFARAAARLLDDGLPEDHLSAWTRHFAQPLEAQEAGTASAVIFRIGAEWLALPVAVFEEVAERRPVHALPNLRNGVVLGLVNVRGELLVCVSIAAILGLAGDQAAPAARIALPRLLVARLEGGRVVFPADEVHGVHRYDPRALQETPATVTHAAVRYTRALLPWQQKSVGLLDEQLLGHTVNRSLSSASAT